MAMKRYAIGKLKTATDEEKRKQEALKKAQQEKK